MPSARAKSSVTIFLVNGVKLQGNITWFDNFCVLLRRDGQAQLVYKHAISTVMPMGPIQLQDEAGARVRLTLATRNEKARRDRLRRPCRAQDARRGLALRDAEARLAEAVGLTAAIGLDVVEAAIAPLARPVPATLLGTRQGGGDRGRGARRSSPKSIDRQRPAFARCSSAIWKRPGAAKVLDRTALILEIFGERAADAGRPAAGRTGASDLSALAAGAKLDPSGAPARRLRLSRRPRRNPDRNRPPPDRRAHRQDQDANWKRSSAPAALRRQARKRVPFPVIALVGYTNAGKSTLFNRLTKAEVLAKDLLFATLDPTMRGAEAAAAARRVDPVRHGGLHRRSADRAGRRLPRHAGRGAGGRRHRPCPRCRP